jgi:TonB family protein
MDCRRAMRHLAVLMALTVASRIVVAQDAATGGAPSAAVTKPPVLLQSVEPVYPAAALAAGKTASVKVRIHIDDIGTVSKVDVMVPVGDGFDEAAVAAAMQYVFDPAEIAGKPAAIVVETAINFVIETAPAPEPLPPEKTAEIKEGPPGHGGDLAAPVSISGTVVERGTRRKLAGVIVAIKELNTDVITDDNGAFFFHGLAPGSYSLLTSDPKYDRLERTVAIDKRETVEVRLWLRPLGGNPYESIVEGSKDSLEVTKRSLSRQQLTTVPGTFGDPIRVIQSLPGLARAPFGLGLLLVRGSNPDDTGVFIDGHEVPLLFHFLGGPSILNPDMVGGIDLYPGGFPARFGRHHGGVVSIDSRPTESDGIHGDVNINLLDSSAYVRAPINKDISVAVAGRRSYIDLFLDKVLPEPSPGQTRLVVPVYYDWQARIDWNLRKNGRLSVFAIGSADKLRVLSKDEEEQSSQDLSSAIRFFRVMATYKRQAWRDLTLTITPSVGRDSIVFAGAQAEASGPFTSVDITQNTISYGMRLAGKLSSRLTIDTGIDMLSRINNYQVKIPQVDDIRGNAGGIDVPPSAVRQSASILGLAGFVDLGIDATSRLRVVPSARIDSHLIGGNPLLSFDPRLVARYRLDPFWTMKGYVGRFSQPPQPEALDRRFGNPNLGIEHGTHVGIGVEWKPSRLWSLDTETYYIDRRELVAFTRDIDDNGAGGESRVFWRNQGKNRTYGVEGIIKREMSDRVFGWLSYTFSVARQQQSPATPFRASAFDQTHTLNAVVSYKPGRGWELGAKFRLSTGRPDTAVVDSTFDADSGGYSSVTGPFRSIRRPLFQQLDLRAEKTWLFDNWSLAGFLDVQNVFNAQNVEAVRYDYRFRNSAPVTSLPFLPTIGIRGRW